MKKISDRGLFPAIGDQINKFGMWLLTQLASVKAFLFGQPEQVGDDDNDRIYKFVTVTSVIISVSLITINLIGSFTAMKSFASGNGIAPSVAMWIPIAIDGFVWLGILVIFGASLVGNRVGWVKATVLVCMLLSAFFNVEHIIADQKNLAHYLLGSIFPLGVYLTSEVTAQQIRHYIERQGSLKTNVQLHTQNATLKAENDALSNAMEAERSKMFDAAQKAVSAEVAGLEEQKRALASRVEIAARHLAKLKGDAKKVTKQTDITVDDMKLAYELGKNPGLTNDQAGSYFNMSGATGGKRKTRVKALLSGGENDSRNGNL